MPFSFPPCPVCGGTQAFFNGAMGESIKLSLGLLESGIKLGALICLKCGHTELRPHPSDMHEIRRIAEKRGPLPN